MTEDKGHIVNNMNHKNMIAMWNYLKDYAKKKGLKDKDINIFEILNLPFPKTYSSALQYYTDPDQWSTIDTYVKCYLKIKEITGDPNTFRNCGRVTAEYRNLFTWQTIARAIGGLEDVITHCPISMHQWQNNKKVEVIIPAKSNKKGEITATFKYQYFPYIDSCDVYCSDDHLLGVIESIPTNFPANILKPWERLPLGQAKMVMVQHDPIKLFSGIFFKHLNLKPYYDKNILYIKDPNTNNTIDIGKKVILENTDLNGNKTYLGKHKIIEENPPAGTIQGTLITKTISYNGEQICEAGVIMGAPYFIFIYKCRSTKKAKFANKIKLFFKSKDILWKELVVVNNDLVTQIEIKNKAYDELKYYSENLENIVQNRTEELRKTSEYLRQLDHIIMRVVSHGLGNWSANAIADANLAINSIKDERTKDKTNEYFGRLITNCGIATLAAIGLNYYCKNNIMITVQDIADFLLRRANLSLILDLHVDEDVKSALVDGRIYMILSEIFQNAIKAQINQGYNDHLTLHINLDESTKMIKLVLKNKGKLHGNLQILKSIEDDFPEIHQGGWICRRLTNDLGGKITWAEEENTVKVILEVPVQREEYPRHGRINNV
jgi:hypothetical protein